MRKVLPGQSLRFPASTFNAFVDAADAHKRSAFDGGSTGLPRDTKTGIVTALNNSGVDQDRFSVLGLDTILVAPSENFSEFATRSVFAAVVPDETYANTFVVLQEPIKNGGFGKALLVGLTPVQVVRPTGNTDDFAGVEAGQTGYLKCGVAGAQMLWEDGYTAEEPHWALVRLPQGGGGKGANVEVCECASTANLALSGLAAVDGVSLAADNLVLAKNQTAPAQNGVYRAKAAAWTFVGTTPVVHVLRGTANGRLTFMLTAAYTYSRSYAAVAPTS